MYQGNTLAQALRAASVGREEATFAIDQDSQQSISYGALWSEAERIASALVALGVQPQDRVAVQIEKSVTAIALYLGTVLCGAIHLPLIASRHRQVQLPRPVAPAPHAGSRRPGRTRPAAAR